MKSKQGLRSIKNLKWVILPVGLTIFTAGAVQAKPLTYTQAQELTALSFKAYDEKTGYDGFVKQASSTFGEPSSKTSTETQWLIKLDHPLCRQLTLSPNPILKIASGEAVPENQKDCRKQKKLSASQGKEFSALVAKAMNKNLEYSAAVKFIEEKIGKHHSEKPSPDEAKIWFWEDTTEPLCKGVSVTKDGSNQAGFILGNFTPSPDACK